MKKIIILTTIISLFLFKCVAQSKAEIIYGVKLVKKETKQKTSEKASMILDLVRKEMDDLKVTLNFNNGKSVFKAQEDLELEDKRQMARNMGKAVMGLRSKYYCDIKDRSIIREHEFDGTNFNITSKFSDLKWELSDETKNIENYKCFKATTVRTFKSRKGNIVNQEVIAWYCPQIPVPVGPKNYVGLPGLILELVEGGNKLYYATSININPNKKIVVDLPKKGEIITEEEYSKKTQGSTRKLINAMKN